MSVKRNDNDQIFKSIKNTKTKGHISDYPKAIEKINSRLGNYFHYVPSNLSNITNIVNISKGDFHRELIWQCNVIQSKINIIRQYLHLKSIYSQHVLNGKLSLALDVLNDMQKSCGWSLWLIEAKFFCLHQLMGLEGNKTFLQEIYSGRNVSDNFDLIYYLSFLISERNEDGCHIGEFHYRINKVINNISDENFKKYLSSVVGYVVFSELNKDFAPNDFIINFNSLPVIDMYELIIRILVEYKEYIDINDVKLPIKILSNIGDKRLNRISSSYGIIYFNEYDIYDGNFRNNLTCPQLYNYLIMLGHDVEVFGDYINKYHFSVKSIVNQDDDFESSLLFFSQFSVNFKHLDDIYSLLNIIRFFLNVSEVEVVKRLATVYGMIISKDNIKKSIDLTVNINDLEDKFNIIHSLEENQNNLDRGLSPEKTTPPHFSNYVTNHSLILNFYSLIHAEQISKAFRLFVDSYINNDNVSSVIRLSEYLTDKKWEFFKNLDSYVDAAIVLESCSRFVYDDKKLFNLKACWRSFMNEVNITHPSELTVDDFNGNNKKYIYFLKNICVPEIIGSAANTYQNERDIKIERIAICNKLLGHELSVEIIEERDSLERNIAILDGLNEVEIAGLTVDQDRFKSVARNKHRNDFNRYKSFVELRLSSVKADSIENSKVTAEHSLITKPVDEGDNILIKLIHDLGDMFLKNHEFGLDYYLSMRIRHGRLIGISRGPLEIRKLVTKYSESECKYLDNEYWYERYKELLDFDSLVKLNNMLADFSKNFDTLMKNFKDSQIQIFSDDKPDGMFSIKLAQGGLNIFKDSIKQETTIDEFLVAITEYFLILIEQSSKEVKSFIEKNVKQNINSKILELQTGIEQLIRENACNVNPITSEIASARTELNKTLDDISSWFDISSEDQTSIRMYTMEDIVEISLARTKRVYQEFSPVINSDIDTQDIKFHSSALALLVDALNIVFSNIFVHGKESQPIINLKSRPIDSNNSIVKINVLISNVVDEELVDHKRLIKIKEEIETNQLKSRQEGGSGFHKLAAMSIISDGKDLDFGCINGEFYVDLTLSLDRI